MEKPSTTPVVRRGLMAWSTRDILIAAMIGIIFGLFLTAANYLYLLLIAPLGPIVQWSWNGLWFIPPVFLSYVSRKPGSAFVTSVIAGLVQLPFSPSGIEAILGGVIFGVIAELALFLLTRYRSYQYPRLILVGLVCGLLLVLAFGSLYKIFSLSLPVVVLTVLATLIGCCVGVVLARMLADAVTKTGVFAGMAIATSQTSGAEEEE